MMNNMHALRYALRVFLVPVLFAGAALASDPARADPVAETGASVTVKYSRQDLAGERGVQILYARLKNAARQVCPGWNDRDLMRKIPALQCYDTALARAVEQVRQPGLTALHLQHVRHTAG